MRLLAIDGGNIIKNGNSQNMEHPGIPITAGGTYTTV